MLADISIKKNKRSAINSPVFSILIPSWNNLSYLKLCVESIRKNSRFAHQIIIHINEGTDGTLAWINLQQDIDYTFSDKNIGVCYALNIARSIAETNYIVYMNDDMYACTDWDTELFKEIEQIGHNYFFLSGTAIEPESFNNCVIEKNYGTNISDFAQEKLLNEFASLQFHSWQGATWPPNVVHKDIWDLVGGYSPEFSPGMYSDPDFSMKLWIAGVRLFKGVSACRVYHFGSKSTGRVTKNKGYYTFIRKWGITSSTLTKYYLRRGEKFDGPLAESVLPWLLSAKNFFKRLSSMLVIK